MAHRTARSSYNALTERLNRAPQGAPPGELLHAILSLLFSEDEAELVAQLPIRPFTVDLAARLWKVQEAQAKRTLDELASRGLLLDLEYQEGCRYVLPPPMAGFFEFSLMRVRTDVDQKVLSELFYQYLNVQEDFVRDLFTRGETQLGRVFVQEPALTEEMSLHVLDFEKASEVIATAPYIGLGVCYCRHKMQHVDRACDKPTDICMTFDSTARSLIAHDLIRKIDVPEAMDLLGQAYDEGLVQFGENVREFPQFMCHCCGCCCEALLASKRFALDHPVHTSAFIPELHGELCKGCGKCVKTCPLDALSLGPVDDPASRKQRANLDEELCLGCGVCVRACRHDGITMAERPERIITPKDTLARTVDMAIERGTLPDLLIDNRALWSHRAMATFIGVLIDLPPFTQILANRQLRSRYLDWLFRKRVGTPKT